jgi:adenylate cyclase
VPPDALLRLILVGPHRHAAGTISAADLLRGKSDSGRLTGAVVVVGGSAPELGGLRETPGDPLTPDAQIQADAIAQILWGRVLRARSMPRPAETVIGIALIAGLGLLALVAAARLAPLQGFAAVVSALLLLWAAAGLLVFTDRLLDPLTPSLAVAIIFGITTVSSYVVTYRREARVRRSFGIESGETIVGDVGVRAKLNYTAYGDAVNAAARLEAANKQLVPRSASGRRPRLDTTARHHRGAWP